MKNADLDFQSSIVGGDLEGVIDGACFVWGSAALKPAVGAMMHAHPVGWGVSGLVGFRMVCPVGLGSRLTLKSNNPNLKGGELIRSFIHSSIHSSIHPFIHSFIH